MEIFTAEPDGRPREQRKLMGRRGYVAIVAYDPEAVQGAFGGSQLGGGGSMSGKQPEHGRLSLAVDFMIQSDPAPGAPAGMGVAAMPAVGKYGPVIVPSLEFGR